MISMPSAPPPMPLSPPGVNQIDGISFGLKDPTTAENQARQLAVRNLQAKASLYAQALGVGLGGIRSLSEGGGYAPQPVPMYAVRAQSMDSGSSTPVAAGELTIADRHHRRL